MHKLSRREEEIFCMGYIYHRKEFGRSMFTGLSTCTILGMKLCVVTLANYWNDGRLLVADCDICRRNKTVHHQNPLWQNNQPYISGCSVSSSSDPCPSIMLSRSMVSVESSACSITFAVYTSQIYILVVFTPAFQRGRCSLLIVIFLVSLS